MHAAILALRLRARRQIAADEGRVQPQPILGELVSLVGLGIGQLLQQPVGHLHVIEPASSSCRADKRPTYGCTARAANSEAKNSVA